MPQVAGVLETSLYVAEIERAVQFYQRIFGFESLVCDERMCALAIAGRQVLLLFKHKASLEAMTIEGGVIPPHDGAGQSHLALAIDESELSAWEAHLAACGVPIESRVAWDRSGRSIYFRDPDRHLLELVTPGCWSIF